MFRIILPSLCISFLSQFGALAADATSAEVEAANLQFYKALNAMFKGDLDPMKEVWSHDSDVTYMGPVGGYQMGWDAVLADWQKQADLKLGGTVVPQEVRMNVGETLAVVHNMEVGRNFGNDGKEKVVKIRATNVYRKENGVWKMIGHHTDRLSFLDH